MISMIDFFIKDWGIVQLAFCKFLKMLSLVNSLEIQIFSFGIFFTLYTISSALWN